MPERSLLLESLLDSLPESLLDWLLEWLLESLLDPCGLFIIDPEPLLRLPIWSEPLLICVSSQHSDPLLLRFCELELLRDSELFRIAFLLLRRGTNLPATGTEDGMQPSKKTVVRAEEAEKQETRDKLTE